MGNYFHTNSRTQSNTNNKGSQVLSFPYRRRALRKVPYKQYKEKDESPASKDEILADQPAGRIAPSRSNFYSAICYKDEEAYIEWLPLEMISHCLSFLPVRDIYRASQVSQKFYKAAFDILLWKHLCFRDLKITQKWASIDWIEYYKLVKCITWDQENCCPEFKFAEAHKAITKTTSYGVATARSKYLFCPSGQKYVFDVKINFRRPNFFYGLGFIDKEVNFNFAKAAYPKAEGSEPEKKYDLQWFYWSDGNCWDILGSHPVNTKSRTFIAKKGIERPNQQPSLAFYTNDTIGVVLDYTGTQPLLTFFLNGHKAHQFTLPPQIELYLAVYFYNASDSVCIEHCESDKYDKAMQE